MRLLRRSVVIAVVLLACVWLVPHVNAAASRWLAAPATKAAFVAVPLPSPPSAPLGESSTARSRAPLTPAAPLDCLDAGFHFNMLGAALRLQHPYDPAFALSVRTSLDGQHWSAWQALTFDASDGQGGHGALANTYSDPLWVGAARYLEYRLDAGKQSVAASGLHFSLINTMGDANLTDRLASSLKGALATIAGVARVAPAEAMTNQPAIVTRAQWGADEALRSGNPGTASLSMAFVHHTATGNDYTRAQAPAIVRAIYYYHTQVLGWYDIGYNFLVDKYGTIYEGRYGSIAGNVIGAQVLGFNIHSMGVALIGTYDTASPAAAETHSLEALLAWKLDLAHLDPLGTALMRCSTTQKFRAGQLVKLPVIAGHRDANYTDCPGEQVYRLLPAIRRAVARLGQPKIYAPWSSTAAFNPKRAGVLASVKVGATLSQVAAWQVTVRDADQAVVHSFTGSGTKVAATWDGRDGAGAIVPDGRYSLAITASSNDGLARAASLPVEILTVPPRLSGVEGGVVSPNGDGIDDTTRLTYTVSRPCQARVAIADTAGKVLRVVRGWTHVAAGAHHVSWDGKLPNGAGFSPAADGTYTVKVFVKDAAGNTTQASGTVKVNSTIGFPAAVPRYFSPNGDGRLDTTSLTFRLERPAHVTVEVASKAGLVLRTFSLGLLPSGPARVAWDGLDSVARPVPSGSYTFTATAVNALGTIAVSGPVVIDDFVPQVAVPASATVAHGHLARIVYRLRDPYSDRLLVSIRVVSATGKVMKAISAGWLAGGRHTLQFAPKAKGTYQIVVRARDRAANVGRGVTVLSAT